MKAKKYQRVNNFDIYEQSYLQKEILVQMLLIESKQDGLSGGMLVVSYVTDAYL